MSTSPDRDPKSPPRTIAKITIPVQHFEAGDEDGVEIGIHILMGLNGLSVEEREAIENAPLGNEIKLGATPKE